MTKATRNCKSRLTNELHYQLCINLKDMADENGYIPHTHADIARIQSISLAHPVSFSSITKAIPMLGLKSRTTEHETKAKTKVGTKALLAELQTAVDRLNRRMDALEDMATTPGIELSGHGEMPGSGTFIPGAVNAQNGQQESA